MICKKCGAAIPWENQKPLVEVAGIGAFHTYCITPEQVRLLEQKIDDVKRWAIDVGIIHVRANHDPEHADAQAT